MTQSDKIALYEQFQKAAANLATNFIADMGSGDRLLLAGPTGVGKSYVEKRILELNEGFILISPKEEIIEGLVRKGVDERRIYTPMKLLNRLRAGLDLPCEGILFDEAHHWLAATWRELELYLEARKKIGLTACPYRGTLKETREFLEEWGQPHWMITYPHAFAYKLIHLPEIQIVPLVNDDVVQIQNGEFVVSQIDSQYNSKLSETLDIIKAEAYKRPTIISVSGKEFAKFLNETLATENFESSVVLAETPEKERYVAIDRCLTEKIPIIQIQTLGEGVDYHFEQIIDLSPIFSPVKWVQLLGRIMRVQGNYICTNRNLIRHAYLLQGAIPDSVLKTDQEKFGAYGRATNRIFTMEALGRFKPTQVFTTSGLGVSVYFLESYIEQKVVKFAAIYHPQFPEGLYAYKSDKINIDGKRDWGKWVQVAELPNELKGFNSQARGLVTEKQMNWWKRSARKHGVDPEQPITQKEFQILPVLNDLGLSLKK